MNSGPERDTKRDQFANLSAPAEAKPVQEKPVEKVQTSDLLEGSFSSKFDHLRATEKSIETAVKVERSPRPEPAATGLTRRGPTTVQRIMNFISKLLKNLLRRILALFGVGNQPSTQKIVNQQEAEADLDAELLQEKKRKKRERDEGMSGPGAI